MYESTLGIHEIELVVDPREHLGDARGVGDHAHRALHLGQVPTGHHRGRLVVDPALEPRGAPVHELDCALCLDRPDRRVHVLGHDVPPVHHAARHVLPVPRVAFGHHRRRLERAVRDLRHRELLMVRLLGRDDRGVRREHEVDAWVRHEVSLELGDVHIERAVEPEGCRERRDHLERAAIRLVIHGYVR